MSVACIVWRSLQATSIYSLPKRDASPDQCFEEKSVEKYDSTKIAEEKMKKIRIGFIVIAAISLTGNFIILCNNNWHSTKTSLSLFAIGIVCAIASGIISLIDEMKKIKSGTKKEKGNM